VVDNILGLVRRLIGEHVRLVTLRAPTLGVIKADPNQLEQMILNLAVNARDAMPEGGVLTIETATVWSPLLGLAAQLTVTDSGHGMDANTLSPCLSRSLRPRSLARGLVWAWPWSMGW
jgi:signal transduction histidine kinase